MLGFLLTFIGIIFIVLSTTNQSLNINGGFIFLIGPVPIIFGKGFDTPLIIVLAAILTIITILFFIQNIMVRRTRLE